MIFWGVKLDSHIWFRIDPFHVDKNFVILSDSDENPAGPTRIKWLTCSGCYIYVLRYTSEQQSKKEENQTSHFNTM